MSARLVVAIVATFATAVFAQRGQSRDPDWQPRIWVGGGRFYRDPPKWAKPSDFDGQWNYCRGFYDQNRYEDGGQGWRTDYPGADNNFSVRLAELTLIRVKINPDGQPDNVVVRLDDPLLTRCPMLYMEDVGTMRLSDDEIKGLRSYLLKGGFLYVDDFWGSRPGTSGPRKLPACFRLPSFRSSTSPPITRSCARSCDVKAIEQVSSIQLLEYRSGGSTLRARTDRRQPALRLPRHRRREGAADGGDDAQHRHLRHLGA